VTSGMPQESPMTRIGLVLGAGGAVGQAYHAGVLHALAETTGFDPRRAGVVVGTSAGSVVAASLRAGVPARDLFARATGQPLSSEALALLARVPVADRSSTTPQRIRRSGPSSPQLLGRMLAQPLQIRPGIALSALLPEGRRDTTEWFLGFDVAFEGGRWPTERMLICAVDLDRGRRVVFGDPRTARVSVAQAVHASCSIPAIFQPAVIDGVRYVDGGVHSPTNADVLAEGNEPLDAVIISSPMSANRATILSGSAAASLRTAARLPLSRSLARERRALEAKGTTVLTFEPTAEVLAAMGLQPMDFSRHKPVAEAGYEAAKAVLGTGSAMRATEILKAAGR
jgi:NTE family protein